MREAILHYQAIFRLGVLPWQSLLSLHSTLHKIFEDTCFHLLKCIFNWCHLATYPLPSVTEELNHYIRQCQTVAVLLTATVFVGGVTLRPMPCTLRLCTRILCNFTLSVLQLYTFCFAILHFAILHLGTLQLNTLQVYTYHFATFALVDFSLCNLTL